MCIILAELAYITTLIMAGYVGGPLRHVKDSMHTFEKGGGKFLIWDRPAWAEQKLPLLSRWLEFRFG